MKDKIELYKYNTANKGERCFYVHFYQNSAWLTEDRIIELFNIKKEDFLESLDIIYKEDGLRENIVSAEFKFVDYNGFYKCESKQKYYNIDAILAVGYQLRPEKASEFREWVTNKLVRSSESEISYRVFKNYLLQIILKFIVAIIVASYIGYLLRNPNKLSGFGSHLITVFITLIAMYDIVFQAMRYSMEKGFCKNKV